MADNFAVVAMTLPTDVQTDGTFDAIYPPGTDNSSFDAGNTAGVVLILDDSDRYSGDQVEVAYAASITVTNKSDVVWRAGQQALLQLPKPPAFADAATTVAKTEAVIGAGMGIAALDPAADLPTAVAKINELVAAYQAAPPPG